MITSRTIGELQTTITMVELDIWLAYRKKYGPMNPNRTFDAGPAIVASMIARAHGAKDIKPKDFMPYYAEPTAEADKEPTAHDFIKAFGRGVKVGRR